MTIRVQWAEYGIQKFQGMDFHDSQLEEALQKCARQWPKWAVVRIILIGDDPSDWVILADSKKKDGRI